MADSREYHRHAVLVAAVDDRVVADAASRLRHILHAALAGALDVVREGEESVGPERHALHLIQPCALFFRRENCRLFGKYLLPCPVRQDIFIPLPDIDVDGIVAVRALNIRAERQIQNLRALSQPPVVRLGSGKPGAVDAGLLAGSDADGLAVLDEAYRIRLGILQSDQGNLDIPDCFRAQVLILCDNISKESVVDYQILTALLKGHAEHLLALQLRRPVIRIDLNNDIIAVFLASQDQ